MDDQDSLRKMLDRVETLEHEVRRLQTQLNRLEGTGTPPLEPRPLPEKTATRVSPPPAPPAMPLWDFLKPAEKDKHASLTPTAPEPEPVREQAGPPARYAQSSPFAPVGTPRSSAPYAPHQRKSIRPPLDWKALLRRLNMLPPEGEGSLEIQVGTWWTVRIGIMAVIGAVFFGIWASQNTPAWVKWIELMGISLGVCALGLAIERLGKELSGFGGIVFAGGLALIDFSAFAAYAVPAVRIFTNPAPSFTMQMAATALIAGCALWRRSPTIATMATLLGYLACVFSFAEGLLPFALTAALLLGAVAVLFYLRKGWTNPFTLAVPLTHVITAMIAARWIATQTHPAFWICVGYPLLTMVLYGATDLTAQMRGIAIGLWRRRVIQIFNSSGAVLIGFAITYTLFHERLDVYYFTFGTVLLAGAAAYYLLKHPDAIMQGYFIKGTALFTMGLITVLDARALWVALAIQSLVLLLSAKRSRLVVIELASTFTWIVSFVYFISHYQNITPGNTLVPLWSADGLMAIGYFLLTCVLFGLHGRWFFPNRAPGRSPAIPLGSAPFPFLMIIHILALIVVTNFITVFLIVPAYHPLALALMVVAMAVSSWGFGHWAGYITSAGTLFPACQEIAGNYTYLGYQTDYWVDGLLVVVLMLVAAAIVGIHVKPEKKPNDFLSAGSVSIALGILWIYVLTVMFYRSFEHEYFLMAAAALGVAVGVMSLSPSMPSLADLAFLPLALAVSEPLFRLRYILQTPHPPYANVLWPLWLALAGALLVPLGLGCVPALKARVTWHLNNERYLILPSLASGGVILMTLRELYEGGELLMMALAVAGVLIALLRRWPGLRTALVWGMVYVVLAGGEFLSEFGRSGARSSNLFLTLSILTAVCAAALAMLAPRLDRTLAPRRLLAIQWAFGALALGMLLFVFVSRTGTAANYTSVFWGLSAIALFVAGLADRIKPFRVLGLVALALCIGRVFLVDIQSTVYRIAAVAAIGCVLLAVGFLYNKYRDVIEAIDRPATGEMSPADAPATPGSTDKS